jgi:hypothetical protein
MSQQSVKQITGYCVRCDYATTDGSKCIENYQVVLAGTGRSRSSFKYFEEFTMVFRAIAVGVVATFLLVADIAAGEKGKSRLLHVDDSIPELKKVTVKELGATQEVALEKLEFGKQYEFVLPIRNATQIDWEILDVRTDCGCTAGIPVSRKIAKGETSSIALSIRPKRAGKFNITVTIGLGNKRADDIKLVISGACLNYFYLEKSQFSIDSKEIKIEAMVRSNFASFDDLGDVKISHSLFDRVALYGVDADSRKFVGTLSKEFLDTNQRRAVSQIVLRSGERQSKLPIEIVREDVVELKPSILAFKKESYGFSARCFIRGDKHKLEKLGKKASALARSRSGEVEADLIIEKCHGEIAICRIVVADEFPSIVSSSDDGGRVTWIVEGMAAVSTMVALDR